MPVTDIKVVGSARGVNSPDRAEVRLQVNRWGRDWAATHQAVTGEVTELMETVKRLEAQQPMAVRGRSIAQISQRSWTDDIGTAYSEAVEVAVVFSDFQVMSQWIFSPEVEAMRVLGITWQLSPNAQKEIDIALSVDAMRDAHRKAETFATAAGLMIAGIQNISHAPGPDGTNTPVPHVLPATDPVPMPRGATEGVDITPVPIATRIEVEVHFTANPDRNAGSLFAPDQD